MVSFRRSILALTVLALFAGLASAQINNGGGSTTGALNCTLTSIPTTLRAEGATETTGDLQITCSGGLAPVPGATVPTATIAVNYSAPITSRLLSSSGASEAVLLIDEPGNPTFTGSSPGANLVQTVVPAGNTNSYTVGTFPSTPGPATEACASVTAGVCNSSPQNVFQGITPLNGSNPSFQVVFQNVPILAPGTSAARIFRISNVRVDANFLGVTSGSPFGAGNVMASVTITNNVNSLVPATVTVGTANQGLSNLSGVYGNLNAGSQSKSNISSLNFLQCVGVPASGSTPQPGAILRYQASFAGAFKTRTAAANGNNGLFFASTNFQNIPGSQPLYSESGLLIGGLTGTSSTGQATFAGLADFGTRLRAVFANVPTGVNVYVSTSNVNFLSTVTGNYVLGGGNNATPTTPTGTISNITPVTNNALALLVMSETVPDFVGGVQSPFSSITVNGVALFQVPLTNGAGEVNWELVQGTIQASQNLDFGIYFQYSLPINTTTGAATTPTVAQSYSPVPSSATGGTTFPASGLFLPTSGPIPRFADTSSSHTSTILSIGLCQTVLLFPFVTNTAGFETGISIANTSADTLGTANQAGTCTFTFFGTGNIIGGVTTNFTQAPVTTASVPAGAIWADTLSHMTGQSGSGAGTFEGYTFATCNFQFAHGFAFITDAKATNLAEGYLALVINNPTVAPPARNTTPSGEGLLN